MDFENFYLSTHAWTDLKRQRNNTVKLTSEQFRKALLKAYDEGRRREGIIARSIHKLRL